MKSKKLTKAGGMTIPSDLRRELNLQPGDAVDIDNQGDKLIISAHIDRCFICQEEQDTVKYRGKVFCRQCIETLGGMIK